MKKRIYGKKLSRSRTARDAMYRSLIVALARYGRIETTMAKAKAVQVQVEKLVTTAKKGTLASYRSVLAYLANDKKTAKLLVNEIVPKFKRESGYTRIVPLGQRRGDNTKMARLEWVDQVEVKDQQIDKKKKKGTKTKKDSKKTETTKK